MLRGNPLQTSPDAPHAYDAAYLHLAQSLSAELVTLDDKLARVWSRLQGC